MISIKSHNRKPVDTDFHKNCKDAVRKQFYYYQKKIEAKQYVNHAHSISVRVIDINEDMRGVFCKFLKSIGEEISDQTLYLLSLLQRVGEDKIRESLGYNNHLCSQLNQMTLGQFQEKSKGIYVNGISDSMFKDCIGISVFVAQAIIFAFNTFKTIWEGVKNS